MNKRIRQYIGLFSAIMAYYVIHEGAHLVYALCIGVFKQISFIGLGMQIDVYGEQMTSQQLGLLCGMFGGGDMNGIRNKKRRLCNKI